mmetsp:Transcript_887/g.5557  ORF Transcript_887/g.5557 Transcript_887/m.5557 type:complete len:81 (-) Transcript_887:90-332(-)
MPSWVLLGNYERSRRSRSNADVKLFFPLDWILQDLLPSLCLSVLDTIDVSELSGSRTGKIHTLDSAVVYVRHIRDSSTNG